MTSCLQSVTASVAFQCFFFAYTLKLLGTNVAVENAAATASSLIDSFRCQKYCRRLRMLDPYKSLSPLSGFQTFSGIGFHFFGAVFWI